MQIMRGMQRGKEGPNECRQALRFVSLSFLLFQVLPFVSRPSFPSCLSSRFNCNPSGPLLSFQAFLPFPVHPPVSVATHSNPFLSLQASPFVSSSSCRCQSFLALQVHPSSPLLGLLLASRLLAPVPCEAPFSAAF